MVSRYFTFSTSTTTFTCCIISYTIRHHISIWLSEHFPPISYQNISEHIWEYHAKHHTISATYIINMWYVHQICHVPIQLIFNDRLLIVSPKVAFPQYFWYSESFRFSTDCFKSRLAKPLFATRYQTLKKKEVQDMEKIKKENAVIIQQSYRGHQGRKIAGLKHIENQQKIKGFCQIRIMLIFIKKNSSCDLKSHEGRILIKFLMKFMASLRLLGWKLRTRS